MDPKEKAKQLINKYYQSTIFIEYYEAIIFTKLCIDEIIKSIEDFQHPYNTDTIRSIQFYKQVKEEIEKL